MRTQHRRSNTGVPVGDLWSGFQKPPTEAHLSDFCFNEIDAAKNIAIKKTNKNDNHHWVKFKRYQSTFDPSRSTHTDNKKKETKSSRAEIEEYGPSYYDRLVVYVTRLI